MLTRPRRIGVGLVAPVLALALGAGCSDGKFGDLVAPAPTTSRPPTSVTLGSSPSTSSPPTTDPPTTDLAQQATSTAAGPRGSTTPPQTGAPPPSQPVVTGARTDATASGLSSAPSCVEGRPLVKLSWAPVGNADQVVAVSSRPDGLDSGNFTASELLPASRAVHELREVQPGAVSYWRVLTRRGDGFAASETAQFQAPICTSS